jgi:hypothetical protein
MGRWIDNLDPDDRHLLDVVLFIVVISVLAFDLAVLGPWFFETSLRWRIFAAGACAFFLFWIYTRERHSL